jgi:hypothetical protein
MLYQHCDIVTSIAQGWHFDREYVEAVEQVFTKLLVGDVLLQITIGSGDDSHIDMQSSDSTQPLKLAILQHPQQFGLQFARHLSDFIQE